MPDLQLLRNASLLVDTAWRHLAEDPLLLAVQSSRRLPSRARSAASALLAWHASDGAVRGAVAEFLADRPAQARDALCHAVPRTSAAKRLAAELAIQLGSDPESLPYVTGTNAGTPRALSVQSLSPSTAAARAAAPALPAATRARLAWSRGDLTGAIAALDGVPSARAQRARLHSELAMMSEGFRLPVPEPSPSWRGPARGEHPRVLHVLTNSFPHTQSGYAVRTHALLRAQAAAGVEVRAVTRIGYPVTVGKLGAQAADVVDGVTYRRLLPARLAPTPAARLVQMTRLLAAEVEEFRPDVLHTTTNYHNALVTQAVAHAYGLPWVYEMRGVLELTWVASRPQAEQAQAAASEKFRLMRAKETEMAKAADAVIVLSEVQKTDLVARGVSADRIRVVPNAVEDAVVDHVRRGEVLSPAQARRQLGLPQAGTWVGSVSSVVPYEGFEVLARAVTQARQSGADVRLLVVGDGVALPGLRTLASRLGLGEDVCVLPGRKAPAEALAWYQALDALCVPRLDTPVCRMVTPIKPLTAMALGRPLVVSDLPALREVAEHGLGSVVTAGDVDAWAQALVRMTWGNQSRDVDAGGALGDRLPLWSENGRMDASLYEELR